MSSRALLGGALALLLSTIPWEARACGGFFCSASSPVNQAAEQIVFSHNGDGTITAIIQIQYQGPSEAFAWVLPIPGVPDVGVSSNSAIASLDTLTQPNYVLTYAYEGECAVEPYYDGYNGDYAAAGGASSAEPEAEPEEPVIVLASGNVGPYDYVVIQPNPDLAGPADVALEWLAENGYDVTSIAPDVLGPYLESGLNLIAFRLTKGNESGSIRPVLITYDGDAPVIPIRPTAVAANPDMGVLVWVLGEHRAVPDNYTSVVLNEARINWFNWRAGYDELVSEAADEAGGHGFVTEYSGPADIVAHMIWTDAAQTAWDAFQTTEFEDGYAMMDAASRSYRFWDGFRDAVGVATTLPEGVTLDDFGRNPMAYRDDPGLVIDSELFAQALFELVIEPVQKTQAVLDARPSMTRLYSTLSPEEMIEDPSFTFNPDLGAVDRLHSADITLHCNPDIYESEAPWTITLTDGTVIEGGPERVVPEALRDAPAASAVLDDASSGPSVVLIDNTSVIDDMVDEMNEATDDPAPVGVPVDVSDLPDEMTNPDDETEPDDAVGPDPDGESANDEDPQEGVSEEEPASMDAPRDPAEEMRSAQAKDEGGCTIEAPKGEPRGWLVALAVAAVALMRRSRRAVAR